MTSENDEADPTDDVATDPDRDVDGDYDVVVVGGGPSGCSAAVFTGRYGLDTVVFDRGKAALERAAYVENYLGFPAGVGTDTLYDLMHDHVTEAGCAYVADLVESVEHRPTGDDDENRGFVVETQEGRTVTTRYVVAASWYDGEYLRPLGGDELFIRHDHGDDEHEQFDPDYADDDGRTPIDGLYVVAPAGERNAQAIVAAGQGAYVARCLLEDHRRDQGYPDGVDSYYDWIRPDAEFTGEWGDRDRWREWFHDRIPDEYAASDERVAELRERYIDHAFETKLTDEEVDARERRGQKRLLDHLDDDLILERARHIEAERQANL
ncbi:Pyridine nucleotide-disulphide oxidoreductase [Halogranum amylolyticum]|uniref:Pyridine nucleotide-disulphide oxidoreductase n=1 Tax=Halogranum amylolyticum TaxID=660520 RepID=A0A1H8PFI7_9EURY|nr:FAD-dependent monooxygenase [Halogranum amylolyticum]SEO40722.1 Pyridine nucleotide-disulphide oxidoreductase [Halogranum amylolyticum]